MKEGEGGLSARRYLSIFTSPAFAAKEKRDTVSIGQVWVATGIVGVGEATFAEFNRDHIVGHCR